MIFSDTILYRRLISADLAVLKSVAETTFQHAFAVYNTKEDMEQYMAEAFAPERIKKELEDPDVAYYLAWIKDEIVGYIKLNTNEAQSDLKDPTSMELERIYVVPSWQNQGIGKFLLEEAILLARQAGKKFLWLGVWDQNHGAIRFYQRHGFTKFGTHDFYLGNDRQTDYLMRLDI